MSATYGVGPSAGSPVSVDFSINNPSARSIPFGVAIQANGQHAPPTAWNPARSAKLIQSYRELNGDFDAGLRGTPFSTDTEATQSGDKQSLASSSGELDESDRSMSSREPSEVSWGERSDPTNSPTDASDIESDNGDAYSISDGFGENEIYEAPSDYEEEDDATRSMSPLDRRIEAIAEDFMSRYDAIAVRS